MNPDRVIHPTREIPQRILQDAAALFAGQPRVIATQPPVLLPQPTFRDDVFDACPGCVPERRPQPFPLQTAHPNLFAQVFRQVIRHPLAAALDVKPPESVPVGDSGM